MPAHVCKEVAAEKGNSISTDIVKTKTFAAKLLKYNLDETREYLTITNNSNVCESN